MAATPQKPLQTAGQESLPDDYKLNMLIRTTLIALSQANQTGNYSVLRDLAALEFRAMNPEGRLAEVFASLRQRSIDFSPVLFFEPKVIRPPAITSGILRLTGFFETQPEQIHFDLGFVQEGGTWRLAALVVQVKPPGTVDRETGNEKKEDARTPETKRK